MYGRNTCTGSWASLYKTGNRVRPSLIYWLKSKSDYIMLMDTGKKLFYATATAFIALQGIRM